MPMGLKSRQRLKSSPKARKTSSNALVSFQQSGQIDQVKASIEALPLGSDLSPEISKRSFYQLY
jgi:hypothetical protein